MMYGHPDLIDSQRVIFSDAARAARLARLITLTGLAVAAALGGILTLGMRYV